MVGNVKNCELSANETSALAQGLVTLPCESTCGREGVCTFRVVKKVKEVINAQLVRHMMELDFSERNANSSPISLDDTKFFDQLLNGICKTQNGHNEMPLPFRAEMPELPNNKTFALRRLQVLKARLQKDEGCCQHYMTFMNKLLNKGHAELVPKKENLNLNMDGKSHPSTEARKTTCRFRLQRKLQRRLIKKSIC